MIPSASVAVEFAERGASVDDILDIYLEGRSRPWSRAEGKYPTSVTSSRSPRSISSESSRRYPKGVSAPRGYLKLKKKAAKEKEAAELEAEVQAHLKTYGPEGKLGGIRDFNKKKARRMIARAKKGVPWWVKEQRVRHPIDLPLWAIKNPKKALVSALLSLGLLTTAGLGVEFAGRIHAATPKSLKHQEAKEVVHQHWKKQGITPEDDVDTKIVGIQRMLMMLGAKKEAKEWNKVANKVQKFFGHPTNPVEEDASCNPGYEVSAMVSGARPGGAHEGGYECPVCGAPQENSDGMLNHYEDQHVGDNVAHGQVRVLGEM